MASGRPFHRLFALVAALLLATAFGCGGDLDSRLAEIRTLQDNGKFDDSIEPLRGLVTTNSTHPEVNYRLGLALVQTGRRSLAIWPLNKAADSEEYGVQAGLLLSATLLSTEDYAEAARAADRVLKKSADNQAALYSRAQANLYGANPEAVLTDTDRLLEIDPSDTPALAIKVGALIDLDRLEDAEALQLEMLDQAAEGGDIAQAGRVCAGLSVFFLKTEREEQAQALHADCLERFPDDPMVRLSATEYYEAKDMYNEAADLFARAVEQTPEDPELRVRLATLLLKANKKSEADATMLEMVELFDTVDAWRQLSGYRRTTSESTLAREALEEAISRAPKVAPAMRFELADLLIEEGNLDRAREIAGELEEPAYSDLIKGSIALSEGNPKEAITFFESGLRRWPNNAGARYLTGAAAEQLGDMSRARTEYREAVRNDDTRTDAALRLAELLFADAEYASALDFAARHINNRPFTGPEAHLIGARSAVAVGKPEKATELLTHLSTKPAHALIALIELTSLTAASSGAAVDAMQRAYDEVDGASENTHLVRALIGHLIDDNRASEALALAEKMRSDANSAEANDLVGRVLLRQGRIEDAKKAFNAALALNADFAPGHEGLGAIDMSSRSYESARTHFDRAAELDPTNGSFLYLGAQSTLALGDRPGAIERLKKTVEVEPANPGACNDLAWLLSETGGDLELAVTLATRATRAQPSANTQDTLGWVHYKRGDGTTAAEAFNAAIAAYGESPSRLYHLGLALGLQGETEAALTALRKAVATDSFPDAAAANVEIERLEKLL